MNTTGTIITVNTMYQIELMPSGNYYPMRKHSDGEFYYFRKGNKQESRKTERGARKFITEYMTRMGETQEELEPAPTVETPEPVEEGSFLGEFGDFPVHTPLTAFFYQAGEIAKIQYSQEQKAEWAKQALIPHFEKWDGRQFVVASPDEATCLKLCGYTFMKMGAVWKSNSLPEMGDYTQRRLAEIRALGFPCEIVSEKKQGFEKSWRTYSIVIPLDAFKSAQDVTPEPPDDDELSPSDLAAIREAMSQPSLGPYTFEQLCQVLEEARQS